MSIREFNERAPNRRRIYRACRIVGVDHDEHARYRAANDNAARYTAHLEQTFVARRRIPEMLGELLAVVAMANETNRLADGYRVPVDEPFENLF